MLLMLVEYSQESSDQNLNKIYKEMSELRIRQTTVCVKIISKFISWDPHKPLKPATSG